MISLEGVTHTYSARSGPVTALKDINLSVAPGERVALLGPSGCGKSTLLRLIQGLLAPTSGRVAVDGKNVRGPQTSAGVVFQRDLLLDWRTVLGNVLLPIDYAGLKRADYKEQALSLLDRVGLSDFLDARPTELSGGMRQRVAICRALIKSPRLLLLDEPFGALDALTREQVNFDVSRMVDESGATLVLVTHSIEEAAFVADRVIVLGSRPGRVELELSVDVPRPRNVWPSMDARYAPTLVAAREAIMGRAVA